MRIFISHSHKDKKFIYALVRALRTYEIETWLDEHEISIGDFLTDRILAAINEVDFFIVVISSNSINSQWVNYELSLILAREQREGSLRLLPVLLQGAYLPTVISNRMYADFRNATSINKHFISVLKTIGVLKVNTEPNKHERKENKPIKELISVTDYKQCPKCGSREKYMTKNGYRICVDCSYQVFPSFPSNFTGDGCPLCGGWERYGSDGGFGYCADCGSQIFPEFINKPFIGWKKELKLKMLNEINNKTK